MRNSRYRNVAETEYPAIRRVMPSAGDHLDDDQLQAILERKFPGADTEDVENFMRTLQQFGSTIAPLAQKALPGIASGAAQGAALGPYGALIGAIGGGAASLLSGAGPSAPAPKPERPAAPAATVPAAVLSPPAPVFAPIPASAPPSAAQAQPGPAAAPASAQPGQPAGAASGGAPADVAARLLALLSSRQTVDALLAMLMADNGRKNVTVANRAVPAPAFANAIAEVAAELADTAGAWSNGAGTHLLDPQGNPRCDLPNPRARAALLLSDLAESMAADDAGANERAEEYVDVPGTDRAEGGDPIDAYEAALEGRYCNDRRI